MAALYLALWSRPALRPLQRLAAALWLHVQPAWALLEAFVLSMVHPGYSPPPARPTHQD